MEGFDLVSALLGALVGLAPYLYGLVRKVVASTETKVDDQVLAALVKAVKEADDVEKKS